MIRAYRNQLYIDTYIVLILEIHRDITNVTQAESFYSTQVKKFERKTK